MGLDLIYSPETLKLGQLWRFLHPVTLEFYGRPWKPVEHLFYTHSSFVHHFIVICGFRFELDRKRSNWVKFDDYLPHVILKFYGWPWNRIGHLFYAHSSFMHHLVAIDEFQFDLQSGNGQIGFWPLCLDLWPLTLTFCMTSLSSMVITPENFMMIRWQEHSEKGVTDGRTDEQTDGRTGPFIEAVWSQLK